MATPAWVAKHQAPIVWLLRIVLGATFAFSGFAKAVDPWGFMYKLLDYLSAWGIDWMPQQAVLCAGVILAVMEFCVGIMALLGCWPRFVALMCTAFMCVMLPLTAYIAIFNPVEDCGCFGEAWRISNSATFAKNIVLSAMAVMLIPLNSRVRGLYHPLMQWIVMLCSILYGIILAVIGYFAQPMVDFRPYKTGTPIAADAGDVAMAMVYERDGVQKAFSIDDLPGDDWTYVGRSQSSQSDADSKLLAVYDGSDDVTAEIFADEGPQLILVVNDPEAHGRARSGMLNRLNAYIERQGGEMIALVALPSQSLPAWERLASPDYAVYSAEDTSLKEMARGDAALIYCNDGIIIWKRNLYFLSSDLPEQFDEGLGIADIFAPDSGRPIILLTLAYAAALLMPLLAGLPFMRRRKPRK